MIVFSTIDFQSIGVYEADSMGLTLENGEMTFLADQLYAILQGWA